MVKVFFSHIPVPILAQYCKTQFGNHCYTTKVATVPEDLIKTKLTDI
jgi:hypothetical protein